MPPRSGTRGGPQHRPSKARLRRLLFKSLRSQGYGIQKGRLVPPKLIDKDAIRALHVTAVAHWREKARRGLEREEGHLLERIASGADLVPARIRPTLVEVERGSEEELLFRYAKLHWSIPVSSGYGRRIRYVVVDQANDCLIGIFGLSDPVIGLPVRDRWIGWSTGLRNRNLRYVMDAYVMGAVPPYSFLLFGKLVAMLAASDEVRESFRQKYSNTRPSIRGEPFDGQLALITTTSALGKSAVYDRINFGGQRMFISAGYTHGWGEFHFSNGVYEDMRAYAKRYCVPSQRDEHWGQGFRNRREVIDKVLQKLGLSKEWLNHGIEREVFVVPLASNSTQFLRGESDRLQPFNRSAADLSKYFVDRWMLPRSMRDLRYARWPRETWRLWGS